jgi:hypothetical protein
LSVTIELDDRVSATTCDRCGRQHDTVRGFLYRDGDAWVAYWAGLYPRGEGHEDAVVVLTVVIGDDWQSEEGHDRCWAQLDIWVADDEIRMGFVDPQGHLDAQVFGAPLTRAEALASPWRQGFFDAADAIVRDDPRVRAALIPASD